MGKFFTPLCSRNQSVGCNLGTYESWGIKRRAPHLWSRMQRKLVFTEPKLAPAPIWTHVALQGLYVFTLGLLGLGGG